MAITLRVKPQQVMRGTVAVLEVTTDGDEQEYGLTWDVSGPVQLHDGTKLWVSELQTQTVTLGPGAPHYVHLDTAQAIPGTYAIALTATSGGAGEQLVDTDEATLVVSKELIGPGDDISVTMRRTAVEPTPDQSLWAVIRASTAALGFNNLQRFMDIVMCDDIPRRSLSSKERERIQEARDKWRSVNRSLALPFPDVDAYRQLKVAIEVFMMVNCGVFESTGYDLEEEGRRFHRALKPGDIEAIWNRYTTGISTAVDYEEALPYLALVRAKLPEVNVAPLSRSAEFQDASNYCYQIITEKLTSPCFLELIWSYWHEEGLLAQTLNAISWRFQNRRKASGHDPLANLEIDPLRPLNQFLWGYIQDEQHRLSMIRRAYEYDHHYGVTLIGKAVPPVRGADSRSRFIEAFHNLLHLTSIFYKEDDDTTVIADGFPLMNALKEVHLLLTEGAHNQYGDLPWTARHEMLMQEWILARPEMREFLPSRVMVAYPESWMDRVEAMKTIQGWGARGSILHFRDLGIFGEQILLGVRFANWTEIHDSQRAANWARYWRPEIQGYIHAYRAVTGIDLTTQPDPAPPAVHLQRRAAAAAGRR